MSRALFAWMEHIPGTPLFRAISRSRHSSCEPPGNQAHPVQNGDITRLIGVRLNEARQNDHRAWSGSQTSYRTINLGTRETSTTLDVLEAWTLVPVPLCLLEQMRERRQQRCAYRVVHGVQSICWPEGDSAVKFSAVLRHHLGLECVTH